MNLETQAVHFSWVLPADQKIEAQQPFVRESKEYWTRVPGVELSKGMTLHTTAKGALIRLSPVSSDAKAASSISADDIVLTANGKAIQGRAAMANAANDAELKMAGTDFPNGTLAFQLRDDIAAGAITLAMPKAAAKVAELRESVGRLAVELDKLPAEVAEATAQWKAVTARLAEVEAAMSTVAVAA